MKIVDKAPPRFSRLILRAPLVVCLALFSTVARTAEVAKSTVAQADPAKLTKTPVNVPRSVFVSNDPAAKDPFFPGRGRVSKFVQPTPEQKVPDFSELQLRGVTGTDERRIALINNQTFAKGDEGEVRMGSSRLKIKVMEIQDKSVILKIEGQEQPRELKLLDRVLPLEQN